MRTFIQTELKNTYGTEAAESIIKCISPDLWQSMAYILLGCSSCIAGVVFFTTVSVTAIIGVVCLMPLAFHQVGPHLLQSFLPVPERQA